MNKERKENDAAGSIGTLSIVATPIGNLSDFSERAIETLQNSDLIAAEDTRNSVKLLNRFGIRTPMTSYHEYNRFDKADELVEKMKAGLNVSCITDAGMPGISDPGEVLVRKAVDAGVRVTVVPGATASLSALVISGLPTGRFRFEGFLPPEKAKRDAILAEIRYDTATLLFYEAPHHLRKTLNDLLAALGDRRIALCRELTKLHEEVQRTTIAEASAYYEAHEPRGEYVLVVEGASKSEKEEKEAQAWADVPLSEHVESYLRKGLSRNEAMKAAADDRKITKREVYQALLREKEGEASV